MCGNEKWLFKSLNVVRQLYNILATIYHFQGITRQYRLGAFTTHKRCMLGELFDFMDEIEKNDNLWKSLISSNHENRAKELKYTRKRLKILLDQCRIK